MNNLKNLLLWSVIFVVVIGAFFRFYQINKEQFVYYDEGMYLQQHRTFLYMVNQNPPKTFKDKIKFWDLFARISLATNKALWFSLVGLRFLFVGTGGLYYTRLISAISGVLSLSMIYLFSRKYFNSDRVSLFSVLILALLPSHVYYSRLGLQESFSTLCLLLGFYFYIINNKSVIRTILSGVFFASVYFTNYRMIFAPLLVIVCEIILSLSDKRKFDIDKFVWMLIVFFTLIFGIGGLYGGKNLEITFGWMFHQVDLSEGHFDFVNLFSYPYYLFKLESFIFCLLFFSGFYFVWKRDWKKVVPFSIALAQMILFSFPQEKGARYICVVLPFVVISVAVFIDYILQKDIKLVKFIAVLTLVVMSFIHLYKDVNIINFTTDYQKMMQTAFLVDRNAKILSTQATVQNLYSPINLEVKEPQHTLPELFVMYNQGFRYLVLDPQAYISFTKDKKRFSVTLEDQYNFILQNVKPVAEYDHFNHALLERFVLEHNENLLRSIKFINISKKHKHFSQLRVYDLRNVFAAMKEKFTGK